MKKYFFIILAIVVVSLIASFVVFNQKSPVTEELKYLSNLTTISQEICKTPPCVIATSRLYKRLNFNTDPCENFYDFACGTFVDETVIHERKNTYSTVSILEDEILEEIRRIVTSKVSKNDINPFKTVKELYQKCINRDEIDQLGVAPLLKVLTQLGGMPALTSNWNEIDFNWETTEDNFVATGFSTDYLVELSINIDPRNFSKYIISVHQPYLNYDYNILYYDILKEGLANDKIKAYYDYMVELMTLLGADRDTIKDEMMKVLEFETTINNISASYADLSFDSAYQFNTIDELQSKYPFMNWFEFVRARIPQDIALDGSEEILYVGTNYLEKFMELIAKTPKRTIANYLFWRIVDFSADYFSKAVRLVKLTFHQKLLGNKTLDEGWKTCIQRAVRNLKHAIGAMFILEKPEYNDKDGATNIVQSIVDNFQDITRQSSWMNDTEKDAVLKMLQSINYKIGAPQEYTDNNWLINHYKDVVINQDTNYYNIILILNKFTLSEDYNVLRKSVEKTQWESDYAITVVSSLFVTTNSFLSIPVGYLRPPFYSKLVQQYLNYAGLGVDASYSITYGASDKLIAMNSGFHQNKTQCFVKQYEKFMLESKNLTINAQDIARKIAAASFSFKASYLAYKRWQSEHQNEVKKLPGVEFSPEQVFWISSAQIYCNKDRPEEIIRRASITDHALEEFRVVGSFQNTPEFSEDFKCKSGSSYMNPVDKCQIFY